MRHTRIVVTQYGGPDALQVLEEECPEPKPGEVRVKVQAAGVSLPDIMARQGIHPETPQVPFTPGWDQQLCSAEEAGGQQCRGVASINSLGCVRARELVSTAGLQASNSNQRVIDVAD